MKRIFAGFMFLMLASVATATTPDPRIVYLVSVLSPLVQAQNPGVDSVSVATYATGFATIYMNLILPNLSVNGQPVVFTVPSPTPSPSPS